MSTATRLDAFTAAYVECALWSSTGDDGEPMDGLYTVDDLAPECLASMVADCADFQAGFPHLLAGVGSDEGHGHDFWLTRNRHGAGFWDRGYGERGRKLTDMAHAYGGVDLYVGDDGLVHGQ
jgi:hypothetical protein